MSLQVAGRLIPGEIFSSRRARLYLTVQTCGVNRANYRSWLNESFLSRASTKNITFGAPRQMLLSMTGYGEAQAQADGVSAAVEVRAINSRYFKLNFRAPEGFGSLETLIESVVRKYVKRGTVQLGLRLDREPSADDYKINTQVLAGYRQQLQAAQQHLNDSGDVPLETLLGLPGVVNESQGLSQRAPECWPLVETTIKQALEMLATMRAEEGHAMAADLRLNCQSIADHIASIQSRTEKVVDNYRTRLTERLQKILADHDVAVEQADIIREVGIFAERCDVSEELVRLRSHLEQFDTTMGASESSGRKLDFLTQEMFRETNTIGSKANDSEISRHVIEIKAANERIREMIQNVE